MAILFLQSITGQEEIRRGRPDEYDPTTGAGLHLVNANWLVERPDLEERLRLDCGLVRFGEREGDIVLFTDAVFAKGGGR